MSNNKAIAYILASMTNTLRAKLKSIETAVDILDAIQGMFGKNNKQAWIEITGKYSTAKIKAGTPVRDHVLRPGLDLHESRQISK